MFPDCRCKPPATPRLGKRFALICAPAVKPEASPKDMFLSCHCYLRNETPSCLSVSPLLMANGQLIQLLPADAPLWHESIHEGDEAGVVSRLQHVNHFVDHGLVTLHLQPARRSSIPTIAPKIPWFRAIFSEIDIRDGPAQKPPRLRVRKCLTLHGCKALCSTAQNQMFLSRQVRMEACDTSGGSYRRQRRGVKALRGRGN